MSTHFLRVNRSSLSSLGIAKCNFEHSIYHNNYAKEHLWFSQNNHRHSTIFNHHGQPPCRFVHSISKVFQNSIRQFVGANSEVQSRPTLNDPSNLPNSLINKKENLIKKSKEAEFFHAVLERSNAYSGTIYQDDTDFLESYKISNEKFKRITDTQNWNDESSSNIIKSFISLSVYAADNHNITIEDQQIEPLISALVKNLASSTDKELIDCLVALKYWPLFSRFKDKNIIKLWKELDNVCLTRSIDWTVDKCLFMMDNNYAKEHLWFSQNNHRHSTIFNHHGQPPCRFVHSISKVFQNSIRQFVGANSEVQSRPTLNDPSNLPNSLINKKENLIKKSKEAEFFHAVLERSNAYSGTIYQDDTDFLESYKISNEKFKRITDTQNWNDESSSNIIKSFISLSVYAADNHNITIEDQQIEPLISALVKNLASSTDKELIDCLVALKYWPLFSRFKDKNIIKLWKELDNVCLTRSIDWTVDKCLFMMDLWYLSRLLKKSYFVHKGLLKISRKIEEFTSAQMIQSLFYMSCKQRIHQTIAVREYEYHIQKYITKLSIEEIGILALAFFKTKTTILNKKILMYTMQRTVEEAETIDPFVLTAISKLVRFSHKPDIGFTANDMVTKLTEKRWDNFSLITGIHLVHINTQIQFFNEEALTNLSEKFCKNPSEARLKDMERIVFFLSLYNFIPPSTPDICHQIVEQLQLPLREKEADEFPLIFLSLIYFLSLLRVFPEKQIQQLLNKEYLLQRYGNKFCIPQQTVQLDFNRVVEGPPGNKYVLPLPMREYLARRYSLYIPNKSYPFKSEFEKLLFDVLECSNEVLGKENNLVTYTLPHFPRADILFRLDDNGNPLPIPEEMKNAPEFEDVHRPVGEGKWYCVVIGGRNMYMHNVPRLVGEQATKLRQLQSLGYTPIVIPSFFWKKEEDKMAYLKLKYFFDHKNNKS